MDNIVCWVTENLLQVLCHLTSRDARQNVWMEDKRPLPNDGNFLVSLKKKEFPFRWRKNYYSKKFFLQPPPPLPPQNFLTLFLIHVI